MKPKIKILIVDDHLVVRMGLAALIGIERDMTVVGEACDGREAVSLASGLKPDIVIMDLLMPGLNGADATAEIRKTSPHSRVLILTSFATSDELRRALDNGAVGALVKDSVRAELIAAIRAAAAGNRVLSPAIERQLKSAPPAFDLTTRQLEILEYVARGLNNREIGRMIGIGADCVKAHLKTAFVRLGVATRSEAVALALRKHLLKI